MSELADKLIEIDAEITAKAEDGCPECHTRVIHHKECSIGNIYRDLYDEISRLQSDKDKAVGCLKKIQFRCQKARYDAGHKCDYRIDCDAVFQMAQATLNELEKG